MYTWVFRLFSRYPEQHAVLVHADAFLPAWRKAEAWMREHGYAPFLTNDVKATYYGYISAVTLAHDDELAEGKIPEDMVTALLETMQIESAPMPISHRFFGEQQGGYRAVLYNEALSEEEKVLARALLSRIQEEYIKAHPIVTGAFVWNDEQAEQARQAGF